MARPSHAGSASGCVRLGARRKSSHCWVSPPAPSEVFLPESLSPVNSASQLTSHAEGTVSLQACLHKTDPAPVGLLVKESSQSEDSQLSSTPCSGWRGQALGPGSHHSHLSGLDFFAHPSCQCHTARSLQPQVNLQTGFHGSSNYPAPRFLPS